MATRDLDAIGALEEVVNLGDEELLLVLSSGDSGMTDLRLREGHLWGGRLLALGPATCGTPLEGWEPWPGLEPDVVLIQDPGVVNLERLVRVVRSVGPRAIVVDGLQEGWTPGLEGDGFDVKGDVAVWTRDVVTDGDEEMLSEALREALS